MEQSKIQFKDDKELFDGNTTDRLLIDEIGLMETVHFQKPKKRAFVAIDNGVSGSIGIITEDGESFMYKTPTKNEQSYTKAKNRITRVDVVKLKAMLSMCASNSKVILERPMVNPKMFRTTMSAMRALEATICVLEDLNLPFEYEDSKSWQKEMLPSGYKGEELKVASLDIGKRLFPHIDLKHPDRDSILMAEYLRRKHR